MSQRKEKQFRAADRQATRTIEALQSDVEFYRCTNKKQAGLVSDMRRRNDAARRRARLWKVTALLCASLAAALLAVSLTVVTYSQEAPVDMPQAVAVVDEPVQEDHENQYIEEALLARASKLENVKITHYCAEPYTHICGTGDGITASGVPATPYVSVAVDPSLIPLGSEVMIDYGDGDIQYYRADDVGGGVNGNHVDVCVAWHQEALALGVKTATVYWVAPA